MSTPVTREQFEKVLSVPRNSAACVRLFADATESNRRELAPVAIAWYRTAYASMMDRPRKPDATLPAETMPGHLIVAIRVAVLATATWSEMRRLPDWMSSDFQINDDAVLEVMKARRPEWFDDWAEAFVTQVPENWRVVRTLNRAGIGTRSTSDAMISGMLAGIDRYYVPGEGGIREELLADPELVDQEIWRLFEVQRPNGLNFASRDEFRNNAIHKDQTRRDGWLETLVRFADEGRLPRRRLLESSLRSIELEFPDAISRWFPKLHEALQPTPQERREFMPRYWSFLRSRNGSTVTFALDVIRKLDAAGELLDEELIQYLPAVLIDKTKSRASQGLKLLERLAKRTPDFGPRVALAATGALSHAAAEIQEAGWKLIERLGQPSHPELVDAVRSAAEFVAPSLRERLAAWLARESAAGPDATGADAGSVASPVAPAESSRSDDGLDDLDGLVRVARELPRNLAGIARIPELLDLIATGGSEIPAVNLQTMDFPRLDVPIDPLTSLDDLIDACAAAVEEVESADELERILDGISRLCDQRPSDFETRTAPLKKRTLVKLIRSGATFQGDSAIADLYATIWAWLTGEVSERVILKHNLQNLAGCTAGGESWVAFPPSEPSWLCSAFSQRLLSIARSAAHRESLLLLSAPTHSGGWIDPTVLVSRVIELKDRLAAVPEFDQALALFRLAPDRRDEARAAWHKHLIAAGHHEYYHALGHALGVDMGDVGPTESLWSAAARARNAWSDDPAVMQRHPTLGPDAGRAAKFNLKLIPSETHPGKIAISTDPQRVSLPSHPIERGLPSGTLRDDIQLPKPEPANPNPIWLLHDGLPRFWLAPGGPLTVRWALTVWPASSAPLLARGLFHLVKNIDWETKLWANREYLKCLLPPDTPLPPIAQLVVLVGLVAKDIGESSVAVDVAIAAIGDGRLEGREFGEILSSTISTGMFKVGRWATSLTEIARPSLLHADAIRAALAEVFSNQTSSDTRDIAQLLELFYQLTLEVSREIPPRTVEWLKRFSGSGKAAKVVKSLLKANPTIGIDQHREQMRLALQSRVDRVLRWMRSEKTSSDSRQGMPTE